MADTDATFKLVSDPVDFQIFTAINQIRFRKQRPDSKAIFEYITNNSATNITHKFMEERINNLLVDKMLNNNKTHKDLDSFFLTDLSHVLMDDIIMGDIITDHSPIPFTLETPKITEKPTKKSDDIGKDLEAKFMAMKHFVMEEIYKLKSDIDTLKFTHNDDRLADRTQTLMDEVKFLRGEINTKNCIIQTLLENQKQLMHNDVRFITQTQKLNLSQDNVKPTITLKDDDVINHNVTNSNNHQFKYPKKSVKKKKVVNNNTSIIDITSTNRYDGLFNEHNSMVEESQNNININNNNIKKLNKVNTTANKKRSVTILGDSIIKGIEGYKMKQATRNSNTNVYVKSFP